MLMSLLSLSRHVARVRVLAAALVFVAFAFGVPASAVAGVMPPDYGIQWSTVGGGVNRPANAQELAGSPWQGGLTFPFEPVAQDFRISKTEITNTQWLGFYRAYIQFNPTPAASISGGDIRVLNGVVRIVPGREQWPATMGWEFAARYANWLHNGMAMTAQAFEQGVYDTSTFFRDENGVNHHQVDRAPGAKFWIPTFSEWVKAAYWDPSKDNGAGGYWRYPNTSDTQLVAGLPGTPGAQTSAGTQEGIPVGSYPDVRSPWGLLDVSGGVRELTSTLLGDPQRNGVFTSPTGVISSPPEFDQLGWFRTGGFSSEFAGLRIASSIPSSSGIAMCYPVFCSWAIRRKRFQCSVRSRSRL